MEEDTHYNRAAVWAGSSSSAPRLILWCIVIHSTPYVGYEDDKNSSHIQNNNRSIHKQRGGGFAYPALARLLNDGHDSQSKSKTVSQRHRIQYIYPPIHSLDILLNGSFFIVQITIFVQNDDTSNILFSAVVALEFRPCRASHTVLRGA